MKKRRNVYLINGSLLILVNPLIDITENNQYTNDIYYNIGYLLGSQFLLIFGVVLLILANKVQKKINTMKQNEFEDSIKNIGQTLHSGE